MRPRPLLAWAALSVLAAAGVFAARPPPQAAFSALRLPPLSVSMPGFGRQETLAPSEIEDLVEYVLALSHREADGRAVMRALPLYEQHCQACHGLAGEGDPDAGVPDLTDQVWRWGGAREDIREQIWRGDDGRGPKRLAAHDQGWGE